MQERGARPRSPGAGQIDAAPQRQSARFEVCPTTARKFQTRHSQAGGDIFEEAQLGEALAVVPNDEFLNHND